MKICTLTKYSYDGSSSRYRFYNYINCFKEANIALEIAPFFSVSYLSTSNKIIKILIVLSTYLRRFIIVFGLLFRPKRYDLIIIEYELFPYFPSVFEALLKLRKIPYIVDYDDAIFHKYDSHKSLIIKYLLKNKIAKVMVNAKAVIVGNDYLESYAKRYNGNTLQLPTVVLLDKYKVAMEQSTDDRQNKPFTIGWIGSKTTSQYLLDILPAIEKIVTDFNVKCHFIGFDTSLLSAEVIKKCNITIIPWSEKTEIKDILNFDVGIMPLKDDAWSKGKCGFKLIQYMSCKLPVIASPVGVNTKIVEDGINGFLASSSDEWFAAFRRLYDDKNLRNTMSVNNWKKIRQDYNHKNNCEKYVQLIYSIVDQDRL